MIHTYDISTLIPYVNWPYFFHAWDMNRSPKEEREKLQKEAVEVLRSWDGEWHAHALFGIYEANSDGDDLIINGIRLPMLRQQRPSAPGKPCLCLSDFVRPLSQGITDKAGAFATTVDVDIKAYSQGDPYRRMMGQTLADRLAEAAAERMHQEVRTHYWGYAPDEQLSMEELHLEHYQGIRPAVGYPSMPDTSMNFVLDTLLDMKRIGIRLTENGMMTPHASVSGLMLAHPKARYFDLGKIGTDQLEDYAHRRGIPVELMRRFLAAKL